jgi:cytochrome P450 family 628
VDATRWFAYLGFDVMSELTYNESSEMLTTGIESDIFKLMSMLKPVIGALTCVPWILNLLNSLPPSKNGRVKWIASCAKRVEKRKKVPLLTLVGEYHLLTPLKNPPKQADLFTYLLDDDSKRAKDPLLKEQDLVYDSDLAIVAGSDTTSGSLAATTFLLAKHPEKFEKLRAEIDPLFTSANDFSHQAVTGKPMLEGCINEALRLFPPVPSGLQRMTPPEGVKIAGRYIPGDTLVSTPTYTIHRGRNIPPSCLLFLNLTLTVNRPKKLRPP